MTLTEFEDQKIYICWHVFLFFFYLAMLKSHKAEFQTDLNNNNVRCWKRAGKKKTVQDFYIAKQIRQVIMPIHCTHHAGESPVIKRTPKKLSFKKKGKNSRSLVRQEHKATKSSYFDTHTLRTS